MADGGDTAVTITNREIYDKVVHLEEKIGAVVQQAAQVGDHETRIRSVERWKYALPATLGSSILSVVLAIILGGLHG